ncbi:uncharacterized protein LOC103986202 [Musa acuminata AAA Group]|uniref:uncharacterized protein LOC103986202 n=1 Tax=Musa acuminata AAA Group TaxID=214697 RepID=UPI0031DBAFAB
MLSSSSELPRPSLQIKQDDKFYCRLLSKESSLTHPSFRVYYGVASGAVPFLWESQPGTPKHTASSTNLPPLTPPPSYYCSTKNKSCRKSPKSNLIRIILPKLSLRKSHKSPSSLSPATSLSYDHRRRHSISGSSFSSRGDEEESDDGSPTSTFCFGVPHRAGGGLKRCFSAVLMKNPLLPIDGRGSGQGAAA